MGNLKRSEKMLIGVAAIIVLVAAFMLLNPSGSASKKSLIPLAQAVQKEADTQVKIRMLNKNREEIEPRLARNVYQQSAEELLPRVVRDLQGIADKSGVHLREVKPLRARAIANGNGVRVPLEVRFRAPFQPGVMKFLYFVEDPGGKMVVEKVSVTSADSRLQAVDVSAQIAVYTRSTQGVSAQGGERSNAAASQTPRG